MLSYSITLPYGNRILRRSTPLMFGFRTTENLNDSSFAGMGINFIFIVVLYCMILFAFCNSLSFLSSVESCFRFTFLFVLCIKHCKRNNQCLEFLSNPGNIIYAKVESWTMSDQLRKVITHPRKGKGLIAHDVQTVCVSADKYSAIKPIVLIWNW